MCTTPKIMNVVRFSGFSAFKLIKTRFFLNFEHCAAKKTILIFAAGENYWNHACFAPGYDFDVRFDHFLTHKKCCSLCSLLTLSEYEAFCGRKTQGCK